MVKYTHPEMFWLFIPFIIVIIIYAIKGKTLRKNIEALGTAPVRKYLLNRVHLSRVKLRSRLLILGLFFVLLALVGPQIGTKLTELTRQGADVIIALDVSTSMNAVDVKPSRLEKAKYEVSRLINILQGDRVGLLVFAGTAHIHCPLTIDYSAAHLFLNSVESSLLATQGTDVSSALKLALENVETNEEKFKVIILVSDGEDHEGKAIELSQYAKEQGIIVHTLGVGTSAGGPIPILDKSGNRVDFKKDRSGNIVTTTLNDGSLNEIARITGGKYIRVENQNNAIRPLIEEISEMNKRELKSHVFSEYEDRYQIFILIAILLLFVEFIIPTRTPKEIKWEGKFAKNK